jgi:hypothetical protein
MNCHDFEATAGELASERPMDAALREKALAHAASCPGCTSRFDDERALTAGLRKVTRTTVDEPPARVGEAVLAAFRGRIPDSRAVVQTRTARVRWAYAAASFAAVALIVTLIVLMSSRAPHSQPPVVQEAANPGPAISDQPLPIVPQKQVSPEKPASVVTSKQPRPADRIRNVGRPSRPPRSDNGAGEQVEIATDFIPLMNREILAQMDGGQVMRVELPRSALMSFGLPMDMERASERIKADVVVGNDGLARAIRFVR